MVNLSLCNIKISQGQYIDLCDKGCVHLNLSTLFVVSHVLRTKVSPEWKLNLGFRT